MRSAAAAAASLPFDALDLQLHGKGRAGRPGQRGRGGVARGVARGGGAGGHRLGDKVAHDAHRAGVAHHAGHAPGKNGDVRPTVAGGRRRRRRRRRRRKAGGGDMLQLLAAAPRLRVGGGGLGCGGGSGGRSAPPVDDLLIVLDPVHRVLLVGRVRAIDPPSPRAWLHPDARRLPAGCPLTRRPPVAVLLIRNGVVARLNSINLELCHGRISVHTNTHTRVLEY